jgi:hypothetical protein
VRVPWKIMARRDATIMPRRKEMMAIHRSIPCVHGGGGGWAGRLMPTQKAGY